MKKSIKCPPQIIHNFKGRYISLGFTLNLNVENWNLLVLLTQRLRKIGDMLISMTPTLMGRC